MPCALTVIVRVERSGRWLTRLIASLDAQSLSDGAFEVIVEPAELGTDIARRMDDLAAHRPNLHVAAPGGAADKASGDWVLDLGSDLHLRKPELPPHALERVVAFGAEHGLDVIVGRTADRTAELTPDLFAVERPELAAGADLDGPGVAAARRRTPAAMPRAGALGGYPVLVVEALEAPVDASTIRIDTSAGQWSDGLLVVSVEGELTNPPSDAEIVFSVFDRTDGSEYWVPGRSSDIDGTRFRASGALDVRTAAFGQPLPNGSWQLRAGLHGSSSGWARRTAVTATSVPPGIVDGVLVVPVAVDGALTLDVGARRNSPVGRLDASDVSIVDSAKGTEFNAWLPTVAVAGESRTPGFVVLDSLKVPGMLIAEAGRARVQTWVSGLAGTVSIQTEFGAAAAAPTGLSLEITPIGTMSVVPTPEPAAKPAPPKAIAPARTPTRQAPPPALARLRQKVPQGMQPVVKALSRNKTARRLYGRFVRR
jgi:hypothetical protein